MIDRVIIVFYLLATICIGFFSSRGIKTTRDFILSDRKFTNITMIATVFATYVGGGDLFGTTEKVYRVGIVFVLALLGHSINMLLIAETIVGKIAKFEKALTVGDIMFTLYGKCGRAVCGICTTVACVGIVGAQISVIGYICNILLGVDSNSAVLIGCATVVVYSSLGGIKAVAFTDLLQFGILVVAVPVIVSVALHNTGGISELMTSIPDSHLYISATDENIWHYVLLCGVLAVPCFDPPFMQRILMSRSVEQARKSLIAVSILLIPFIVLMTLTGFCSLSVLPNVNPDVAFPTLMNMILPIGLKGLAIVGIIAIAMSTADSYLNVVGISFVHDLARLIFPNISDKRELSLTRIATIVFGAMAYFAATSFTSILDIVLYFNNFWTPIMVVPMFCGTYGMKASPRAFLCGVIAGGVTTFWWMNNMPNPLLIGGIFPGVIANFIALYSVHKIEQLIFSRNNKKGHLAETL